MNTKAIKPRYQEITPEIIRSVETGKDLLKQPECLFSKELSIIDQAIELKGGKVSRVYKIGNDGLEEVLKISTGLYRMTELKREAEILCYMKNSGMKHIVPSLSKYKISSNYAYLVMEYIDGKAVREKLTECESTQVRAKIWNKVGQALSEIHNFYQNDDLEYPWLDEQLKVARINWERGLIDDEEFKYESPQQVLNWLIHNKPIDSQISLIHGDYRTKNIMIDNDMNYKVIDWGFVDLGDSHYDLAIIDYYFKDDTDRNNFYQGYGENRYNKLLIQYYDKLSKFINV